jgi:hypothetical protein
VSGGRSGPFARNLIGAEQECKSLEDIAHSDLSQDAEAITESGLVDRSDLGDVYDARTRKSGFTLPQAHVTWHRSKPDVRCDRRDYRSGDGASIETVVLYDKSGTAAGGC